MEKFIQWMENNFVPVASKVGRQRHLVAIRDGFVALMPVVMAGSLAVLLNNLFFTPDSLVAKYGNMTLETSGYLQFTVKYLKPIMDNMWWGSLAVLALVLVFTLSYSLASSYEVSPLSAAVVAVSGYLALTPQGVTVELADKTTMGTWGNFGWQYFNTGALFTAIIIALLITQIFVFLMKKKITFKLPDSVPPAVGRAFAAIIPGLVAILLASIVPLVISLLNEANVVAETNLFDILNRFVTQPFMGLSQNPISAVVYVLVIQMFWFFGLHGGNMIGAITNALYLPAVASNAEIMAGKVDGTLNVFTSVFFDSFVHIGGAGATLAIVLAILIASKRKDWREITKIGAGASVFQINEPIMFGLPVVLNSILLIPFFIVPVVLTLISYFATVSGLVGYTNAIIPWVMPVGFSGFLATSGDWRAAVLGIVNLLIAIAMYYPFVILANRMEDAQ